MRCDNCREKLEKDMNYCPMCGTIIIKEKKKMNPLVTAGIAGVCASFGVFILEKIYSYSVGEVKK